jgi:hypothetical protein
MDRFEVRALIRQTLREHHSTTEKVAVEICGKLQYLTEREIRALQVIACRKALESEEAFDEFTSNVIVYKGRRKGHLRDKSSRIMHFQKNGKFEEPFDPGFFDVNDELAMTLFDLDNI